MGQKECYLCLSKKSYMGIELFSYVKTFSFQEICIAANPLELKRSTECFHMKSRRPYWCPKLILWELHSFLMKALSFVLINLHVLINFRVSEDHLFLGLSLILTLWNVRNT